MNNKHAHLPTLRTGIGVVLLETLANDARVDLPIMEGAEPWGNAHLA
jgi:hypothetical protein